MGFESREEMEKRFAEKLGFISVGEPRKGVDVLNRSDYASEDDYLDAIAEYDLKHQTDAYKKARADAAKAVRQKAVEAEQKKAADAYTEFVNNGKLSNEDMTEIRKKAILMAQDDLVNGHITLDDYNGRVEKYDEKLQKEKRREIGGGKYFNAMLRAEGKY